MQRNRGNPRKSDDSRKREDANHHADARDALRGRDVEGAIVGLHFTPSKLFIASMAATMPDLCAII